uniref:Uncharacterized protein n=1 Tax=Megaselia scalaris TaxID=36166 RepID=T1GSE8_MEGSC
GKGRGRPPKDKSEVKSNESKDDSKKGRGRPPKEDSDSPVSEKKGRGRPAKTEGASPAKSPKISSKSPGSGKGRGRPSKNNDSEKPAKDKSEKSSTPDDNFSESEPSIEMTKKRKRESDDEDSEECSLLQKKRMMFSNILAHNKIKCVKYEEAQKKRGRGRPKKSVSNSKKEKSKKVYVEEIILPKDKSMEKAEPLPSKRHEKPKVIHVEIAKPETPEEEYELMEVVNEPLEVENFSHISTQIPFQERKKQRKQIIPSSTPLPKSNNRNSHLNICGLTPIPQEQRRTLHRYIQ